jgi:hypothetical protein
MLPQKRSGDSTLLYVDENRGSSIAVFDVSDPSHVRTASTTHLDVRGPFDLYTHLDTTANSSGFGKIKERPTSSPLMIIRWSTQRSCCQCGDNASGAACSFQLMKEIEISAGRLGCVEVRAAAVRVRGARRSFHSR